MSPHRLLATLVLSAALAMGGGVQALASPAASAPPPAPHGRQVSGPTRLTERDAVADVAAGVAAAKKHPGQQPAPLALAAAKEAKEDKEAKEAEAAPKPAAAPCPVSAFTGSTGAALVHAVTSASVDCVNSLFSVTGSDQYYAFREAQMITVANALHANAASYDGTNTASTEQLVLYLRAGYYVQFNNPGTVGAYTSALASATEGALDAFYANPATGTVSDANGATLGEAVTLIDSAGENARYLYVVKRLLNAYNSSYGASWYMTNAVNNVFTVLYRGQWAPGYPAAVQADPGIVDTVYGFAVDHLDLLGGNDSLLDSNAGGETARFVQYPALQARVRPLITALLGDSAITGPRAALWVQVAVVADADDAANCSSYGTCDLPGRVTSAVLTQTYTCSPGVLRIVAQSMTGAEFQAACSSLLAQNAYFHNLVRDGGNAVADDHNATMEVVVFHSPQDYRTYAGVIYGVSTDNGGIYLEGDPSAPGNQPRFIAYQKPADDGFPARIWNLNHEYTHYLDGRYDTYGDFTAETVKPDIWWIEGLAEYVSYSYRNLPDTEALTDAPLHTYALSTLFDSTYGNADVTRTYPWGYLAVRYMFERHRSDVTTLLGYYRSGNYAAAYAFTTSLHYDGDFASWLDTLSGSSGGQPECPGVTAALGQNCRRSNVSASAGDYAYFYIWVPAGTTALTVGVSGGTGDADLYFNPTAWATTSAYAARSTNPGNAESLTVTGLRPGAYNYLSLYATTGFSGATVTTSY